MRRPWPHLDCGRHRIAYHPKTRRWGVTLLVTLGITWVICEFGVKELLAAPRPSSSTPATCSSSPRRAGTRSLGSYTHGVYRSHRAHARPHRARLEGTAWVAAIAIAFSRLYLFVHFPTDVLAGAVIGVLAGLLGVYISNRVASAGTSK